MIIIEKKRFGVEGRAILRREGKRILCVGSKKENDLGVLIAKLKKEVLRKLEKCKYVTELLDHQRKLLV